MHSAIPPESDFEFPRIPISHYSSSKDPFCDHCKRPGTTETLKRCAGCSTMFYCNKECQRAAWKSHRTFCLPPPLEISALNIGKIVDEWCRIHVESITTLINCIVYLSGGAAHALSEPRGIVCSLSLRANWDGNPATALRLLAFDLRHKDEAEPLRCQWASLMVCNRHAEKEGGAPKRAAVAGLIPLVFCVKDHARFTGNGSFPIFRSRLADDTTLNACTRFVLTRVAAYCRICITNGVVHGDGTNTGGEGRRSILNTGRYRRQGKKWRWVRYSPGESHDPELEQLCTQVTVDSGGMMGMRLVWAVYDQVIRG